MVSRRILLVGVFRKTQSEFNCLRFASNDMRYWNRSFGRWSYWEAGERNRKRCRIFKTNTVEQQLEEKFEESERKEKEQDPTENLFVVTLLWVITAVIFFAPYGIISQILKDKDTYNAKRAESPVGELCYHCGKPATRAVPYKSEFTDQIVHYYFCRDCVAPPKINEDPILLQLPCWKKSLAFTLFAYVPNFFRVLLHLCSKRRIFKPTEDGAAAGLILAVVFWALIAIFWETGLKPEEMFESNQRLHGDVWTVRMSSAIIWDFGSFDL